jgi:hypothetical protein
MIRRTVSSSDDSAGMTRSSPPDQVDVRATGHVVLPEHLPAEIVLPHDREAATVPPA